MKLWQTLCVVDLGILANAVVIFVGGGLGEKYNSGTAQFRIISEHNRRGEIYPRPPPLFLVFLFTFTSPPKYVEIISNYLVKAQMKAPSVGQIVFHGPQTGTIRPPYYSWLPAPLFFSLASLMYSRKEQQQNLMCRLICLCWGYFHVSYTVVLRKSGYLSCINTSHFPSKTLTCSVFS